MTKVSVIIPVYNVALYVEECINSVLSQTYKDLEIIIVDDCGTDDSMELVERTLAKSDRKIIILKHPYNQGLSVARNTGIRHATGDYLYFLDSDDYLSPHCIERLVRMAEKYSEAEIIHGSAVRIPANESDKFISVQKMEKEFYEGKNRLKRMVLLKYFPITVWNRLIKRTWLLENQLFFCPGIMHEDQHWNYFAAKYVTAIALCKDITYFYRYNSAGIMATKKMELQNSIEFIIKDFTKHIDKRCVLHQLIRILWASHTLYIVRYGGETKPALVRYFVAFIYLWKILMSSNTQSDE